MTETSQMEQTTPVNYNLNLSDVPYDEKFRLNQASATQLVRGLQEMANRLAEPTNEYQKELYPAIKKIVSTLIDKYSVILQSSSEVEREVKRFNLHGYSGKVKNSVSTKGVKFSLVYKFANFGDYLKTVTQRMSYIIERPVPQRYVTNISEGTAYSLLKTQLQEFLKYLSEDVEQSWNTVVSSARTAGGNSVQENLRKRTEKQFNPKKKFKKLVVSETNNTTTPVVTEIVEQKSSNTKFSKGGKGGKGSKGTKGGKGTKSSKGGKGTRGSSKPKEGWSVRKSY